MSTPESREFVTSRRNDAVYDFSAEYYAAYLREDNQKFARIIEELGFPKQ